jgi:hypothetical protein
LPVFAFTTMSILISVATRSSTAGVGLPVCIGLVMQLLSYVNGPRVIDRVLLTSPLVAWHGLFTEHRYYGPLIWGAWTSAVYLIACLSVAATLMQRRDMSG